MSRTSKKASAGAPSQIAAISASSASVAKAIDVVRDLAWAGQHAQAVARCSQELAATYLEPGRQMQLHSLRAESFIAQGRYADAELDAAAMLELAGVHNRSELRAEALSGQALVRMRQGHL